MRVRLDKDVLTGGLYHLVIASDSLEEKIIRSFAFDGIILVEEIFDDVSKEDWYRGNVQYVYDRGIMTGLNDKLFGPADPLARAQFAVILHRMNGAPQMGYQEIFPDVEDEIWYTDAVLWASSIEVVTGYTDSGMFGPADPINREQIAVMMFRYAKYLDYPVENVADLSKYQDGSSVNTFAREAMEWAVGNKIITGKDNGTRLDPQGNAVRAECAAIIQRFLEKYE